MNQLQPKENQEWNENSLKTIEILNQFKKNIEEENTQNDPENTQNDPESIEYICPICNTCNCYEEDCEIEMERQDHLIQFWADF